MPSTLTKQRPTRPALAAAVASGDGEGKGKGWGNVWGRASGGQIREGLQEGRLG